MLSQGGASPRGGRVHRVCARRQTDPGPPNQFPTLTHTPNPTLSKKLVYTSKIRLVRFMRLVAFRVPIHEGINWRHIETRLRLYLGRSLDVFPHTYKTYKESFVTGAYILALLDLGWCVYFFAGDLLCSRRLIGYHLFLSCSSSSLRCPCDHTSLLAV